MIKGPQHFDAVTAPQVKESCSTLLMENPYLVIDLAGTTILASAGLAVLAHLHKLAIEVNGQFRVANCSDEVLQTIRLVRMDKLLSIHPQVSSATAQI